jgi:hypothetical protein
MDTLKEAKAANRTLSFCNKYTKMLVNLKGRYTDICTALSEAHDLLHWHMQQGNCCKTLLKPAPGSSSIFGLREEDDEDIIELMLRMETLPSVSLEDLLHKAKNVSTTIIKLIGNIWHVIAVARVQLKQAEAQWSFMNEVEQHLQEAEAILHRTTLGMARNRCQGSVVIGECCFLLFSYYLLSDWVHPKGSVCM